MTRRTFRRLSALAFAVVLIVAACSESEKAEETTATTELAATTTTGPQVLDAAQLDDAVLTLDDLPPGWLEDPYPVWATVEGGRLCPNGRDLLKTETHEGRDVAFAQDVDLGPWVEQDLSTAPDADEHFADHKNAATSCVGQTWTEEFEGVAYTDSMVEISAPQLGDQQAAYRITSTSAEADFVYTTATEYVLIQNGSVLEQYWGQDDEYDPFDPGEFAQIVETGNAKVDEAIGGT